MDKKNNDKIQLTDFEKKEKRRIYMRNYYLKNKKRIYRYNRNKKLKRNEEKPYFSVKRGIFIVTFD
tara:strand:- start:4078 stop:4275 length:198 start_codon:yes stop_codon:yes gene_type:complete